jgi:hypothetical protein
MTVLSALHREVMASYEQSGLLPMIRVSSEAIEGSPCALDGTVELHPKDLDRLLLEQEPLFKFSMEPDVVPRAHQVREILGCGVDQSPLRR